MRYEYEGEPVTVTAERGQFVRVTFGDGSSEWVHRSELSR